MRSAHCLLLAGLGVIVAVGCGSSNGRSGFGSTQDDNDPADGGSGASSSGASSSGFGGDASGLAALTLDPKNSTVIIDTATTPATIGTQVFKVVDEGVDITGSATFTLKDPSLGTFSGATFTSLASLPTGTLGKSTTVIADSPKGEALGTLTVVALRKTGASRDFFFLEPYNDTPSPTSDVLKFSTNIKQADVAFVMDTTGSMSGSIDALKTALSGTLLAQLQAAIPDVGIAIVDHKDFGQGDTWGVNVRQPVTTSLPLAKAAVNAMSAGGGGDEPEAQVGAMYFALTGQANTGTPALAAHVNTVPGTYGGVDFRPGSVPVLVEITDAHWHDPSGNATLANLKAQFTAHKAKFVSLMEDHFLSYYPDLENQANDLSDSTGSSVPVSAFGTVAGCSATQCCTGVNGVGRAPTGPGGSCRLNFLTDNGTGTSTGIVKAIEAIAVGSTFDVTAKASNDPTNAGGVDATKFIQALRAMDEGDPTNACPAAPATDTNGDGIKDTFTAVKAGTPVCFEIIPAKNTTVPPGIDPQFFNAFINVIAVQGNLALDKRSVLFLVPPKDAVVK